MTDLVLTAQKDVPWSTSTTPEGASIRNVQYQIKGTSSSPLDTEIAKTRFHENIALAGPRYVWAVPDANGTMVRPGAVPLIAALVPTTATTTAMTTTTSSLNVVVVPVVVEVPANKTTEAPFVPIYQSSLLLKTYTPSDKDAISETLHGLWAAAIGKS